MYWGTTDIGTDSLYGNQGGNCPERAPYMMWDLPRECTQAWEALGWRSRTHPQTGEARAVAYSKCLSDHRALGRMPYFGL